MSKSPTQKPKRHSPSERTVAPPKVTDAGDGEQVLDMSLEQRRGIAGTTDHDFLNTLVQGVARTTPGRGGNVELLNGSLAALAGIQPRDELEGMLAAQMVSIHHMAMEMAGRALSPDQTVEGVSENVARTTKLMRTFTAQIEALQRYRTGGEQRVIVERVTVSEGGQAVIGNVNKGGRGDK